MASETTSYRSPRTTGIGEDSVVDGLTITHGLVGPKKAWKEYLEACGRTVYFLHRDEIDSAFVVGALRPCWIAVASAVDDADRVVAAIIAGVVAGVGQECTL